VTETRIYVYNFADLTLVECIDTCINPRGLCALNPETNSAVLVTPFSDKGWVRVRLFDEQDQGNPEFKAHDGSIAAIALTKNGEILATASEKGTLIRIWSTKDRN